MAIKNIVKLIFELGFLKRQKHTGWWLAGIKDPDSVGEHALRAAQIGYILAVMEGGVNPERVASILIMHDNPETRIGDHNKVTARYLGKNDGEESALKEQLAGLEIAVAEKWQEYFMEFKTRNTKEGIVAKDADWLETAFQAKEYLDLGYESTSDWINNVGKALETDSAKKLFEEMQKTKFTDWWQGLKKMTYQKLDHKD